MRFVGFILIFAPVMKKNYFIAGAIALSLISLQFSSCDNADEGIQYCVTSFPVGEAVWRNVSSEDQSVISGLINNMVKVESCQFYMGAQSYTSYRANYFPGYKFDTLWYSAKSDVAYWRDSKTKDTLWFNPAAFHFVDTFRTKYDTIPFAKVYNSSAVVASAWVGPVTEISMPEYYIGKYEITQREWMAVMHRNPSGHYSGLRDNVGSSWFDFMGLGDNVAAYNIWYEDACAFCDSLSAMTGLKFRLPTEAEWECAARGGRYCRGYRYPGSDTPSEVGWIYSNSAAHKYGNADYGIHTVGEKTPNELGLYDMCGNVSEWVANSYYLYGANDSINPIGKTPLMNGADTLIQRGGSWMQSESRYFGSAHRKLCDMNKYDTDERKQEAFMNCGFRICISK